MEYVYVGKLVNTHGLKGEVKLLSNFDYKDYYFKKGIHFYIGDNKEKVTISSYRHHKMFDMFLFDEYNYINDVLKFKGSKVYIDRDEVPLKDGELFISDYIGMDAYFENKFIGKVSDIIDNNGYKLFVVNNICAVIGDNSFHSLNGNFNHLVIRLFCCNSLRPKSRSGNNSCKSVIVLSAYFNKLIAYAARNREEENFKYRS